jgi:hypothetical protein
MFVILLDTAHFSVLTDARHARHVQLVSRLAEVEEGCGPLYAAVFAGI